MPDTLQSGQKSKNNSFVSFCPELNIFMYSGSTFVPDCAKGNRLLINYKGLTSSFNAFKKSITTNSTSITQSLNNRILSNRNNKDNKY
mmetsp:Transcript_26092/g.31771  ORF Transcript_26092/g.31771 Transcript_26092/m.31771 type:complete len:88 (+) Transcript_26092:64-327(+)